MLELKQTALIGAVVSLVSADLVAQPAPTVPE
jgi:hypothetical protein